MDSGIYGVSHSRSQPSIGYTVYFISKGCTRLKVLIFIKLQVCMTCTRLVLNFNKGFS